MGIRHHHHGDANVLVQQDGGIEDLLAALPGILDEVEKIHADNSGSSSMTALIASAGALLAIGGGFFIKSKFQAAQVKDECESLL